MSIKKIIEEYSEKELRDLQNKYKSIVYNLSIFLGILIGATIYGIVKKGVDFFTFFPLFFIPIIVPTILFGIK
jgi:hypothetical protein